MRAAKRGFITVFYFTFLFCFFKLHINHAYLTEETAASSRRLLVIRNSFSSLYELRYQSDIKDFRDEDSIHTSLCNQLLFPAWKTRLGLFWRVVSLFYNPNHLGFFPNFVQWKTFTIFPSLYYLTRFLFRHLLVQYAANM